MKTLMVAALLFAIPSISLAETEAGTKGQIVGALMQEAALMDALYSKCQLGGKPYDVNLKSFRALIVKKWGPTLEDLIKSRELALKANANQMADDAIQKLQGCESKALAEQVNRLENSMQADLERFNKMN
jgi:c-di-GMP-related signal transduction protein